MGFQRRGTLPMLIFIEELAAVSPGLATLLGAHYLGVMPILLSFDLAAQRRVLRPLCERLRAGEPAICAFAITEPEAGSDVEDPVGGEYARLATTARRVAGGYVLNGRKCFISGGNLAALTTVFAALEPDHGIRGWTCFAVPMSSPGVQVVHVEDKMGQRISPAAELCFDEVFVPDSHRIGRERSGWQLNPATLDLSRPLVGGIALGGARTAIHESLAWAERSGLAGDRFLQHEIARLIGAYAAAHALVVRAVGMIPPLPEWSAMAKFFATDTAMKIVSQVMDWMGLEASLSGCRVERLYRDIRLTQIYEGTNEINRLAVFERKNHGQPWSWPDGV
ncbi:MAG: acyl-CoA dehydrogenase family protein [Candidatus Binatia bacterium]|nr:acyl-CoA dehydrogenase family protein [Candidatus Binatia bacterium]